MSKINKNLSIRVYFSLHPSHHNPQKTKSSLCKKEMQIFHNLAFYGDNKELFDLSMLKTKNRVVVKRMINNEYLVDKKPDYQILGKTIRYDVYLKK